MRQDYSLPLHIRQKLLDDHMTILREDRIQLAVTVLGTLMAIGFLIAAMWVLWREGDHMVAKLASVTAFVAVFATWLVLFKRKNIFVATAAYAAVLVVYVGRG